MTDKKRFSAGHVQRQMGVPGGQPGRFEVEIHKEGLHGGRVLSVMGEEKTLVEVAADAVVAALNKASGR